jgi:hypothetical protein
VSGARCDLEVRLDDVPGALARFGDALGTAGVSIEGGGAWVVAGQGAAHFLIEAAALDLVRAALAAAGVTVVAAREVVTVRLAQDTPGQLGGFCRGLAEAAVNVEVLYSDHDHQLCVVVDDPARARAVAEAWSAPMR